MKTQAFLRTNSRLLISLLLTAVVMTLLMGIGQSAGGPVISFAYHAPPLPKVGFDAVSSSGPESTLVVNLAVSLSKTSTHDVTVNYAVTGGGADSVLDFNLDPGTLTFNPGQTGPETIVLNIVNDSVDETNESVVVKLSSPVNATLGQTTVHIYTIVNDDEDDDVPGAPGGPPGPPGGPPGPPGGGAGGGGGGGVLPAVTAALAEAAAAAAEAAKAAAEAALAAEAEAAAEAATQANICRYDADGSGEIERGEAVDAATDYLLGRAAMTKDDAVPVVSAYLLGLRFRCV